MRCSPPLLGSPCRSLTTFSFAHRKLKKTVEAAGKGEKVDLAKLAAAIIQMLEGSDEEIEAALMTTYALTRRLGAWFNQELRQILPYVIKHAFAKSDKPVKLRIFTAEVLYSIWLRNPLGVSYLSAVDPKYAPRRPMPLGPLWPPWLPFTFAAAPRPPHTHRASASNVQVAR